MNSSELSIATLRTLAYHSVFNYPLSPNEIHRYLIGYQSDDIEGINSILSNSPKVRKIEGKYYLTDHTYNYNPHYEHRAWIHIGSAQHTAITLSRYIKGIRLIAVSGSTAALNSDSNSDIDLFLISDNNRYWTIRFSLLSLLKTTNQHVNTKKPRRNNASKFCANYFIKDSELTINPIKQDLYTAMEIAHLKVLINNNDCFQHFLLANQWIQEILPNFWKNSLMEWPEIQDSKAPRSQNSILTKLVEGLLMSVQTNLYSIKNKKELTTEPIWTRDYREEILHTYNTKLKHLEI
jgi:hypothetical protein